MTRAALIAGLVLVIAFVVAVAISVHGLLTPLIALVALAALVGSGNLLYGKNSHGAAAQARIRPAQEAHNRAIDEARRQAQESRPSPVDDSPPAP